MKQILYIQKHVFSQAPQLILHTTTYEPLLRVLGHGSGGAGLAGHMVVARIQYRGKHP